MRFCLLEHPLQLNLSTQVGPPVKTWLVLLQYSLSLGDMPCNANKVIF